MKKTIILVLALAVLTSLSLFGQTTPTPLQNASTMAKVDYAQIQGVTNNGIETLLAQDNMKGISQDKKEQLHSAVFALGKTIYVNMDKIRGKSAEEIAAELVYVRETANGKSKKQADAARTKFINTNVHMAQDNTPKQMTASESWIVNTVATENAALNATPAGKTNPR